MKSRATRVLAVYPAIAASVSVLATAALAGVQVGVLDKCDPKLGCSGGIWIASVMAAVLALLVSLLVALVGLGVSELMPGRKQERSIFGICLLVSLGIAIWLTWPGWRY